MRKLSENFQEIPFNIVGGNKFGRYTKISTEQTFNMIVSDGFLVPYAGYKVAAKTGGSVGRGIYTSNIHNIMVIVIDNIVYSCTADLMGNVSANFVGEIDSFTGTVYIDENTNNQISISDGINLYVYNPVSSSLTTYTPSELGFTPGYITYQDTRFISPGLNSPLWFLSPESDVTGSWDVPGQQGSLQSKPDNVVACLRFPGRGNSLLVFGSNVTEIQQDVGAILFPYQRNVSQNIDYGCVNASTIASNTNRVVWLAQNEKSGPTIMYTDGNDPVRISTDGIDFKLAQLTNPSNSYAFLFRQDGHDIYQITFPDDNVSYIYDFNTNLFFTVTDQDQNYHIATRVAFFNETYYFVSNSNGNIYNMSTNFTNYDSGEIDQNSNEIFYEIPRIRVTENIRLPNSSRFSINNANFLIESGVDYTDNLNPNPNAPENINILPSEIVSQRVILTVSLNGGYSFGSGYIHDLKPQGLYRNRLRFWRLGSSNDFVLQIRFYGLDRFLASNGIVSYYQ